VEERQWWDGIEKNEPTEFVEERKWSTGPKLVAAEGQQDGGGVARGSHRR
jgi:hypothetical protein